MRALRLVRLSDFVSAQQAASWAVPGTADDVVVFPVYLKIPRIQMSKIRS